MTDIVLIYGILANQCISWAKMLQHNFQNTLQKYCLLGILNGRVRCTATTEWHNHRKHKLLGFSS
jgi:hypothetical protein